MCELCPRRCGRRPGFCGAGDGPRVFRWGPHFGEEPPLTGERGSGCVFFSRCTMKCLYCQNSPWSWKGRGVDKTIPELTEIFRELAVKDRVENWNLVSPTPYLPYIREAVKPLADEGIRLPFVWNSSGYERVETLEEYADLCDWALFDLRYSRNETASAASAAPGYVVASRAAVRWAWERVARVSRVCKVSSGSSGSSSSSGSSGSSSSSGSSGSSSSSGSSDSSYSRTSIDPRDSKDPKDSRDPKGLIIRILVLPGHADEAIENLAWLATELSNEIPVSVMSQFTPAYKALETPPFDRSVTREEYESVTEAAADFGFENGWIQGYEAADPKLALLGENMTEAHGTVR